MNELVKVEASDYGLDEKVAQGIAKSFQPMLDKMVEMEEEHNVIMNAEISEETCKKAKELRLRYVKVRTGTATIHTEVKKFYRMGGLYVDGWKNAQLFASQGKEEKLNKIENHYADIEKARLVDLQEARATEVIKYTDIIQDNLGVMLDGVWDNYIAGLKVNYETRIAAEKKAEQERVDAERKQALKQTRLNQTSRLIDYIDDYDSIVFEELSDKAYKKLCDDAITKRTEYEKKQEAIRIENEKLKQEAIQKEKEAEKERLRLEEVAQKERVEAEKERVKLEEARKLESDARAKIEAELQANKEAEAKRLREEAEAQEAELSKGDKEKYGDFKKNLSALCDKYTFKSKKFQEAYRKDVEVINQIVGD